MKIQDKFNFVGKDRFLSISSFDRNEFSIKEKMKKVKRKKKIWDFLGIEYIQ